MFIEVAIVTVLMATKKKKNKKLYISSQQGKEIDASLELKNKTWMCCLSTHFTTFDH